MQERAICKIVELMTKHISQEPRTLFVMGSYRIGKERAYLGAAKAMGFRCHVNADKLRVSHNGRLSLAICGVPPSRAHLRAQNTKRKCCLLSTSSLSSIQLMRCDLRYDSTVACLPRRSVVRFLIRCGRC